MVGDRKNKTSWFVVGIGMGALAGILFAPKAGCETRKAIAVGVEHGVEHLTTMGRDIQDHANQIADSGLKRAKVAIDTAKRLLKRVA
jgi:gas vesicle protein